MRLKRQFKHSDFDDTQHHKANFGEAYKFHQQTTTWTGADILVSIYKFSSRQLHHEKTTDVSYIFTQTYAQPIFLDASGITIIQSIFQVVALLKNGLYSQTTVPTFQWV